MNPFSLFCFAGAIFCAVMFLFVTLGNSDNPATDNNPAYVKDLGEGDLLNLSCNYVADVVRLNGGHVVFCRKADDTVIVNNIASTFIKVKTNPGNRKGIVVRLSWQRSVWWPSAAQVIGQ